VAFIGKALISISRTLDLKQELYNRYFKT